MKLLLRLQRCSTALMLITMTFLHCSRIANSLVLLTKRTTRGPCRSTPTRTTTRTTTSTTTSTCSLSKLGLANNANNKNDPRGTISAPISTTTTKTMSTTSLSSNHNNNNNNNDYSESSPSSLSSPVVTALPRGIIGYGKDEEDHWVAYLECGHNQHVRHDPPMVERPWVLTPEGRNSMLGYQLGCKKCIAKAPRDHHHHNYAVDDENDSDGKKIAEKTTK